MSLTNFYGSGQLTMTPPAGANEPTGEGATIPETIPQTERPVYRDSDTVIRVHPAAPADDALCVTLSVPLDAVTTSMTPAHASTWHEQSFETAANTVDALPDDIYGLYRATVTDLTERFAVSIAEPTSGYGRCHRRHDGPGIVSFRT